MPTNKHPLPTFLREKISLEVYSRWLTRKAASHARRDKDRTKPPNGQTLGAYYRVKIHEAVEASDGRDFYTGEELNWTLLSKYDNVKSKEGKHGYKAEFALLPTLDHAQADDPNTTFRICAWRTNDAKHDLSLEQFIKLCKRVISHHEADNA